MQQPYVIGRLVDQPATFDDEGNVVTPATYQDGWHVNTLEPVPEWSDYLCDPQPDTPAVIYAGGVQPVCYKFPDGETFEALLPEEPDAP